MQHYITKVAESPLYKYLDTILVAAPTGAALRAYGESKKQKTRQNMLKSLVEGLLLGSLAGLLATGGFDVASGIKSGE